MKKLFMIMAVVSCLSAVNAEASYNITEMSAKMAQWVTGSRNILIPATVTGPNVAKTIALSIPPARAAKIGGAIIGIGATLAGDYIVKSVLDWSADKGFKYNENGELSLDRVTYTVAPAAVAVLDTVVPDYVRDAYLVFGSQAEAGAYVANLYSNGWSYYAANTKTVNNFKCDYAYATKRIDGVYHVIFAVYGGSDGWKDENVTVEPVTEQEKSSMVATLQSEIENGSQKALDAAWAAIQAAAKALSNAGSSIRQSAAAWPQIINELNNSITSSQVTYLDGQAAATPEQWAQEAVEAGTVNQTLDGEDVKNAVIAALTAKGLSQAQVQSAVAAAIAANADIFGGGLTPAQVGDAMAGALDGAGVTDDGIKEAVTEAVEEVWDINGWTPETFNPEVLPDSPEKKSITTLLESLTSAIMSLPILSAFQNMTVQAGGSPSLSISIPSVGGVSGQTVSVSFGDYSGTFEWMGHILLGVCGIRWTCYLFEG